MAEGGEESTGRVAAGDAPSEEEKAAVLRRIMSKLVHEHPDGRAQDHTPLAPIVRDNRCGSVNSGETIDANSRSSTQLARIYKTFSVHVREEYMVGFARFFDIVAERVMPGTKDPWAWR